ncbi:MAG: hypothetical protein H7296_01200 [Bacteroidia bacterium]|nr:hypothetical protein [Bacteroidia bacterium]
MKPLPLHIQIPKPCNENFADMPMEGEGKLCGKCETIVYDFSQMTDAELIRFFQTKPETHCGRFHDSQLNRKIETVTIRKNFLQKFVKIAASVIAILTLRSLPAKAQGVMKFNITQASKNKNTTAIVPQDFFINGTVKDRDNNPLQNVKVNFGDLQTTTTNENGTYRLELKGINASHNIYFSCINYVSTVRTFNPVMGNTDFNVELGRRDTNAIVYSSGIMVINSDLSIGKLPALNFKPKDVSLTIEIKEILSYVATKMKGARDANIEVRAFTKMHSKQDDKNGYKRLELIKLYLIEREGISSDRIATVLEMGESDVNRVDLLGN